MEARPRKRTGYMRGEMRSGGECARATEMPATATEAANVNATAMKAAATAEAASTTVETAAATAEATTTVEATAAAVKTAATAAMASAASRAGIRHGGQQHRASERGNA
jgi:hypothetical protein